MCVHAACIVLPNRIIWCETESHTDAIEAAGLDDSTTSPDFVRVQIVPPGLDYSLPLEQWTYQIDQDFKPDWYHRDEVEAAVRAELPAWLAAHVVLPDEVREAVTGGLIVACYGRIGYVRGSARIVSVSGSARIDSVSGSARIDYVRGSARIGYVSDSARIDYVRGSARIDYVRGSARIGYVSDSARIDYVRGSARIVSVSGSARIASVSGSARIDYVRGSARIDYVSGQACVHAYSDSACAAALGERGHIVDMRVSPPRIIVACT